MDNNKHTQMSIRPVKNNNEMTFLDHDKAFCSHLVNNSTELSRNSHILLECAHLKCYWRTLSINKSLRNENRNFFLLFINHTRSYKTWNRLDLRGFNFNMTGWFGTISSLCRLSPRQRLILGGFFFNSQGAYKWHISRQVQT